MVSALVTVSILDATSSQHFFLGGDDMKCGNSYVRVRFTQKSQAWLYVSTSSAYPVSIQLSEWSCKCRWSKGIEDDHMKMRIEQ